jgi:hypothetical protein
MRMRRMNEPMLLRWKYTSNEDYKKNKMIENKR